VHRLQRVRAELPRPHDHVRRRQHARDPREHRGDDLAGELVRGRANAPLFLEITQTIVGGTGRFAGATGSGTGTVNTVAGSVIIASGTITLP
jgi:hypothetical protein